MSVNDAYMLLLLVSLFSLFSATRVLKTNSLEQTVENHEISKSSMGFQLYWVVVSNIFSPLPGEMIQFD